MLFVVDGHFVCCLQPCCLLFTAMLFVVYSHVFFCLLSCSLFVVYSHVVCCLHPWSLFFPAMLFATILMSLTAMTLSQSPYIDYLTCSWQYAAEGSDAQCESGYIAIGACGSETSSDCNTNAAGVQCCRIKGGYYCRVKSKGSICLLYKILSKQKTFV